MVEIYERAKAEAGYNATRFIQMVSEQSGLATAQQLLAATNVSDGFAALWQKQRLEHSVEAYVLRPEFQPLFAPHELDIARERLRQYGYND